MKYAIEAYFDRNTEAALAHLAGRVAEEGISTKFLEWKSRPHITLACYNDIDEVDCIPKLKAFAAAKGKLPIAFHSVGMFTDTGTIFASPVGNGALFALQRELHAVLCGYDATGWEWYLPDRWTPHCTLALTGEDGKEAFYRASGLILREFRKMQGAIVSAGLVRISFPVEEIYTADLGC